MVTLRVGTDEVLEPARSNQRAKVERSENCSKKRRSRADCGVDETGDSTDYSALIERLSRHCGSTTVVDSDKTKNHSPSRKDKIPGLTVLFYTSVRRHDSEGMINIMCELTPSELRAVVSDTCLLLIQDRTGDVELRVDDYDRVVLFDGQANQGVAMAASGAYQRFSRFYDGSFRYGIELLFNAALKSSLDSLFRGVCGPAI